ncbi:conserved hypothetical protein [Trichinella spiralis]|uniref:hypothetical protein n=1 Tax=Trichinella spiralis TaxID=6334 RepID=UPI0001EFD5EF|nr:conserved hypothetical protein [Trichinella spiralis]
MTELLGAGATGNDWSGQLKKWRWQACWVEAGQKQRNYVQASAEIKATCVYHQLNNRCRRIIDCFDDSRSIGQGRQSRMSKEFSHHCVRNLVVRDSKQVGLPDERTVDRGSNESGRVWNILWQRESTLSPSLTRKCCAVDVH